jgi:hypothetical protein
MIVTAVKTSQLQSQSYLTTDGQSAGLSYHLRPATNFSFTSMKIIFRQFQDCYYGVPSMMRGWVSNLQLLLWLANAVFLRSEFHGTHDQILVSHFSDLPNLGSQVTVFTSLRNRDVQLHSRALGSSFVASYDFQGYGVGILTRLHTKQTPWPLVCKRTIPTDRPPSADEI